MKIKLDASIKKNPESNALFNNGLLKSFDCIVEVDVKFNDILINPDINILSLILKSSYSYDEIKQLYELILAKIMIVLIDTDCISQDIINAYRAIMHFNVEKLKNCSIQIKNMIHDDQLSIVTHALNAIIFAIDDCVLSEINDKFFKESFKCLYSYASYRCESAPWNCDAMVVETIKSYINKLEEACE